MTQVNIVLVGKTGHGKSSTGNTILQKMAFEEACQATDGTEILELKRGSFDNINLRVYDTPGIMSLRYQERKRKGSIRDEMDRLMVQAEEIHIFVFVFNFINRFTQEEKETVKDLKEMFGENFLRKHGMVVVTHGDNCDKKAIEAGKLSQDLFNEWCRNAGEDFEKLISEVRDNVLIVNNTGDFSESSRRLRSSEALRAKISTMPNRNSPFTKTEYDKLKSKCVIL